MNMKWMLGISLLGLSLPAMANQDLVPYVGADAKWNNMDFKRSAGGNVLPKNYPQGNLFGGVRFNECVAVEVGYETTTKRYRTAAVPADAEFFGLITVSPLSTKTKTKISGFHANIVGFYPVMEEYCLSLFGSIGLANLKLRSHLDFTAPPEPDILEANFSKRKVVPRITLGVQHMLNGCLGIRAMAAWENTSAFKKVRTNDATALFMKPKDSRSLGIGIFFNFK